MGRYTVETELFKGEDAIGFPDDCDGDHYDSAVFGTQLAFDSGRADKAVYYIAKDGELLDIITTTSGTFDLKEVAVSIENIKEKFGV
jgi:hypothetical protein